MKKQYNGPNYPPNFYDFKIKEIIDFTSKKEIKYFVDNPKKIGNSFLNCYVYVDKLWEHEEVVIKYSYADIEKTYLWININNEDVEKKNYDERKPYEDGFCGGIMNFFIHIKELDNHNKRYFNNVYEIKTEFNYSESNTTIKRF